MTLAMLAMRPFIARAPTSCLPCARKWTNVILRAPLISFQPLAGSRRRSVRVRRQNYAPLALSVSHTTPSTGGRERTQQQQQQQQCRCPPPLPQSMYIAP